MLVHRFAACIALCLGFVSSEGRAAELRVAEIVLSEPGQAIARAGDDILVRTASGKVYRVTGGAAEPVAETIWPNAEAAKTPAIVPDGRVAHDPSGIFAAWYAGPTEQYGHAALGDPVEALQLVVQEGTQRPAIYQLLEDEVFEDLEPRIIDLDRELGGRPEIVTITATASGGGAVAVFGLGRNANGNPALVRLATSSRIGQPYRWLNIAGIADFDGDDFTEIAYVDRPHIRGELVFLEWRGGRLGEQDRTGGFANHHGGSRVQDLSEVADIDGDGRPDLLLPDRGYRHFVAIGLDPDGGREIGRIPVPSAPVSEVLRAGLGTVVYLDRDGRLQSLSWKR